MKPNLFPLKVDKAPEIKNFDMKVYLLELLIEHTDLMKRNYGYELLMKIKLLEEITGPYQTLVFELMRRYRLAYLELLARQPFFHIHFD